VRAQHKRRPCGVEGCTGRISKQEVLKSERAGSFFYFQTFNKGGP
jgi:hypothetical protein